MTKDEARHVAAILTAWADGETIQWDQEGTGWIDIALESEINHISNLCEYPNVYRIKPKPREWWIAVNPLDDHVNGGGKRLTEAQTFSGYDIIRVREVIDK